MILPQPAATQALVSCRTGPNSVTAMLDSIGRPSQLHRGVDRVGPTELAEKEGLFAGLPHETPEGARVEKESERHLLDVGPERIPLGRYQRSPSLSATGLPTRLRI
jgi:hypothetical protein